ncbi:Na+/H+ antiporter NhaA [Vibrio viridaestus]|uniref:Na(+)/H(+) antiporter NhaA n=1 Tax=Vibrio viridaestus TaxID=2487322 RepID=A0A3N9TC11_9VIBR|nr:Na+/H+ antiporter NhaA [Vibrio viridaestus]RQW61691.1 Na+/H+ antiporter NhaA [Vibrio viridaestus]
MNTSQTSNQDAKQAQCDIRPPLEKSFSHYVRQPFQNFVSNQTTGAMLLLAATILALYLSNSEFSHAYHALEDIKLGFFADNTSFELSAHEWINDGLMVLFFFMLGLEVKREFIAGELSSIKASSAVIMAAIGGMVCPALIYSLLNFSGEGSGGWGVPMATDTAFALGVMALLGGKVNPSLKIFLVALAIVDDIGSVIVIAIFYTDQIMWNSVAIAAVFLVALVLLNRFGIRGAIWYVICSLGLWYFVLESGIHATMAGVLAALTIPARPTVHPVHLAKSMHHAAGDIDKSMQDSPIEPQEILGDEEKDSRLSHIERKARLTRTPLRIWEDLLDKPVSLFVVPIFAFLNAGTTVSQKAIEDMSSSPIAWGVILGLVVGKPIGIFSLTWLSVKTGIGQLSNSLTFKEIFGLAILAGMGFTMSMFVALLGFESSQEHLISAKLGIMLATVIAGVLGYLWLRFVTPYQEESNT